MNTTTTTVSASLVGMQAHLIRVEAEARRGPAIFDLLGLTEVPGRESRVRVRSALAQIGADLGQHHLTVNLSPGEAKKTGAGFDLAIAAALLGAIGMVRKQDLADTLFVGELSLLGVVQPVRGVLPQLLGAKARGVKRAVVPRANEAEAALVDGMDVRTAGTLDELLDALQDGVELPVAKRPELGPEGVLDDMAEVCGQAGAKRALEIAAAGGHNVLMIGPPGSGKTMLARRLPSILPRLTHAEALEVTAVHSAAGLLSRTGLVRARPFRAPHHTVSDVGLVGGGDGPRPGEAALAHHGVLFLDELPEFRRSALEALQHPLDDGEVVIARTSGRAVFPAQTLLVGAMNPCPCGYHDHPSARCTCSPEHLRHYRARAGGPILYRIDVHVTLAPVEVSAMQGRARAESSAEIRARVEAARAIQLERQFGITNAALSVRQLAQVAQPCDSGQRMLRSAVERLALSAHAYERVLRVSRSIADLDGSDAIRPPHIAEAIALSARKGV